MDVSKLLEKAREATERRNYDYALDLYVQALRMDADNVLARRELRAVENRMAKEKGSSFFGKMKTGLKALHVKLLFSFKKWDAAVEKAEEALKSDPGHVGVMMLLGKALKFAGHKKAAVAVFEDLKIMNIGGKDKIIVEGLRELAFLYEAVGQINEAQDTWAHVLKVNPADIDAGRKMRDLAAHSMHSTISASASTGMRGGIARATQTAEQKVQAAKLDREKGDIKTPEDLRLSIEDKKQDIAARPEDAKNYQMLGDLYKQAGNFVESKKSYEQACEKDKNNPSYAFKIHDLEILKMTNNLKTLQQKQQAGDKSAAELIKKERMALLDFRLKSYIERERQYSTDSRIRFDLGNIYFEMAELLAEKGDTAGANPLYDQAITRFQQTQRDPKFRNISGLRLGVGFTAKGQYDLAIKRFDETLVTIPSEIKNDDWKTLSYAKADTLQKAGRNEDAKATFLQIYEVDVAFRDVGKRVEALSEPVQE